MKLFKRENYLRKMRSFYSDPEMIKVITGVRRCGKSCLMETVREELLEDGISEENIIFLDLDSRKYRKIKTDDQLEELIESLSPANGLKYLFIDEIQNVHDFEEVVNAFRDDGEYSIFMTGSNSYLLSGELATKLTGRYIEFELFPLSFEEYIEMKTFYERPVETNLNIELNRYLLEGGFPKAIQYETLADKRTYVKAVIDEIFEKDIRRRIKIRNKEAFEKIRTFVINNFGATTSVTSMLEALRKEGIIVKRETLNRYIDVLCDAKILYECSRFDLKSKKSLRGEKKYYLADTSFYFAVNTDNRINYGPTLENMVYIYARSRDYSVSVGKIGKLECDFIMRDVNMNYAYVQVAYTILESRTTEDREYASLEKIRDNYPKYVITTDYLLQQRNGIKHRNLMEFIRNGECF
ncbi:MAG: ATP-binding protein [Lachnospiraceae bacterium]|nr:ATP-binding protein [Lachnospiraceae bacterium]